ncbi:unnamed protein product [Lymnaea stagnalis]|uniref:Uncharacterized protein n=1 Tax=Lymnaea stagnalis TaxID=6523 RepID=A0AAV2HRG2_LYMST
MHATNTRSSMCHPLGVSDMLKPSTDANSSDLHAYLKRLTGEEDPRAQTTFGTDVTTSQTVITDKQRTDEEHNATNEHTINLTQTGEFSTQVMSGSSTDVGDTTKTYNPYVSTDDSANLTSTLSQLETMEQIN